MSFLHHQHSEDRPWGSFEQFTLNEPCTVKIVRVSAGTRLSLQKHSLRAEYWKVIEGDGVAHIGDEERSVTIGDELEIPVGTLHRLTGGPQGCAVLEISLGEFDENDIERVEDDFGRA